MEGGIRRHDHQSDEAAGRFLRLVARALHDGRGPVEGSRSKVFVRLYNEGLIYKDKRLVNWDPKFQTAISDLEVVQIEKHGTFRWEKASGEPFDAEALAKVLAKRPSGHMYYFRYPLTNRVPRQRRETSPRCDDASGDDAGRHGGCGCILRMSAMRR